MKIAKIVISFLMSTLTMSVMAQAPSPVAPRLIDAVKQYPTFQQEVKSAFALGDIDYAAMQAGPQAPSATAVFEGTSYQVFDACEAHNCADNAVFLFAKPVTKQGYMLESVIHIRGCSFNQLGKQDLAMQRHVANLLGRTELDSCQNASFLEDENDAGNS